MALVIAKEAVGFWLRRLMKGGMLVAPVRLEGGDVAYRETLDPDEILLNFTRPLFSIKAFLLPQEETLFTFHNRSPDTVKEVYDYFPRVFFGIRPCDLKAVQQADRFFGETYPDPFYLHRRQRTLLIGMACNKPEASCFCHLTGISPFSPDGADVFLIDLGNTFLVETATGKGREAVERYSFFFSPATEDDCERAKALEKGALLALAAERSGGELPQTLHEVPTGLWSELSRRCFGCGGCSYVCPLCFCYNVVDREKKDLQGERLRTWDSCIFEGFTRMAGRHNLIKSREERLRKRFAHKLEQYPEKYGMAGCTGCGRCSEVCLGGIGMREVIAMMRGR